MKRLVMLMVLLSCACRGVERSDIHLCESIMDRIVDLELAAMNIHDEELSQRRRLELHRDLAPELQKCVGRRAPKNAHLCVEGAKSMAELTHDCLAL